MTTIINTPGSSNDSSGGMGVMFIFALILLGVVGYLFMVYALPALRDGESAPSTTNVEINLPPKAEVTPEGASQE